MEKKSLAIITLIIILVAVFGVLLYSRNESIQDVFSDRSDTYEYQNEDLERLSEDAGINLELNLSEEAQSDEEVQLYENQIEEPLPHVTEMLYSGVLYVNPVNNSEWTIHASIPTDAEDVSYGLWKEGGRDEFFYIGSLSLMSFEKWEYVNSDSERVLEGSYVIGSFTDDTSKPLGIEYRVVK